MKEEAIMPFTYLGLDVTKKIGLERIMKVVCEEFDLDIDLITSKKRQREIVDARHQQEKTKGNC
jgi:chromosomal replication initiation ATPase DnaA